jgi:hypothetical protein
MTKCPEMVSTAVLGIKNTHFGHVASAMSAPLGGHDLVARAVTIVPRNESDGQEMPLKRPVDHVGGSLVAIVAPPPRC